MGTRVLSSRPSMAQIGALEELVDAVEGVLLDIRAGKKPSECLVAVFHLREMYRRFCLLNVGVRNSRWMLLASHAIGLATSVELLHDRYVIGTLGNMRIERA